MKIRIPDPSLVVLIGASGAGKSTFAAEHFLPTEVVSSDWCRGAVSDDENSQTVNDDAFDLLHFMIGKRLANMRLSVVDATNVQEAARSPLLRLAREHHLLTIAIVLDVPESLCVERNAARPDRSFGAGVVRGHRRQLRRSLKRLRREGFRYVHVLRGPEEVAAVEIERVPLYSNKLGEQGPFDIIGDVHGCYGELAALLDRLGYRVERTEARNAPPSWGFRVTPPGGEDSPSRRLFFVGDLVDRGPNTPDVLRLAMSMVTAGTALAVPGNHDVKLVKALKGKNVRIAHGLDRSLGQLAGESEEFRKEVVSFIDGLVSHYVLDHGKLCVAHAGLKEAFQGRASGRVREFCLYGETTGETDEFGLPIRHDWAAEYRGEAMVVYGHTPIPRAEWFNNTICLDTGCVFGGELTALRYPERELVSVPALEQWSVPVKPLQTKPTTRSAQQDHDDVLDIEDALGKRVVETRLRGRVTIHEENAVAALEVMSRWAVDPRWLVYLPPTMSPSETTKSGQYLEHPAQAFEYFEGQGTARVVCQEKHMGSRAVVVLARDVQRAAARFGTDDGRFGVVYTRTGRPFFADSKLELGLLERVRGATEGCGLFEELETDWVVLDCELMPWSMKAQELLRKQYAAVGAAARRFNATVVDALSAAQARGVDVGGAVMTWGERQERALRFVDAYRHYCWPVESLDDVRIAPFHVLATEGAVHANKDHLWHAEWGRRMREAGAPTLMATPGHVVELSDDAARAAATAWWEKRTADGGEGMVVKPAGFVEEGPKGIVQPAVKCRGREYLRIIYGPNYDEASNLERLRKRGLGRKRSLAMREFALGIEALERFVAREPLRRVHECVFGVLALESEPVDPRL